jgi:glycosyltransferase involved in cell wall biosynthesis
MGWIGSEPEPRLGRRLEGVVLLISIIIPAYNEAAVIARCLDALLQSHGAGEFEILVVCNGCSDDTAAIARAYGGPVRVIETDVASKTHALNLGDASAAGFPRIYMDADVVLSPNAVRDVAAPLQDGSFLASAPRPVDVFLPRTSWGVRAYYRFWGALPYIQEGMIAAGVYALSRAGRERFGEFPGLISDDGYVRLLFRSDERILVEQATSSVFAPTSLPHLMKIRTRSRLGFLQLQSRYPELAQRESQSKRYGSALLSVIRRPSLYLAALVYAYVTIASWLRARRQLRLSKDYVWERDDSSRVADAGNA